MQLIKNRNCKFFIGLGASLSLTIILGGWVDEIRDTEY